MTAPVLPLLATHLRSWLSAKGFVLVVVASMVPLLLTGAWAATHDSDVAADKTSVAWTPANLVEGNEATFTALVRNAGDRPVGPFNATIAVGTVFNGRFLQQAGNTTTIDGLAAGEERTLTLTWTARPGAYYVLVDADPAAEDLLAEHDEINNQVAVPFSVGYASPGPADTPAAPTNLTGNATATTLADATVVLLGPDDLTPDANATFTGRFTNDGPDTIENATIVVELGRSFFGRFTASQTQTQTVTLAPGETRDLALHWTADEGVWWIRAYANVTSENDPDGSDNVAVRNLTVDPAPGLTPPDPPEQFTIKDFYLDVLSLLHLRILVPFIALFYAAGVVADERERGTLAYVLTRPVPRWLIPVTKFAASYVVAAIALALGILGTYLLLFGNVPAGKDVGFLTTPLLVSLVALFVYGALFVLFGVFFERPYLVGVAFVIGWETVAPLFVEWVGNLTLTHHVVSAIQAWRLDEGLQWLPATPEGVTALRNVALAAAAFLALASIAMKQKEFEV